MTVKIVMKITMKFCFQVYNNEILYLQVQLKYKVKNELHSMRYIFHLSKFKFTNSIRFINSKCYLRQMLIN